MLKKAIRFAIMAHHGQVRKGTQMAYIEHPIHVGMLLERLQAREPVVVAGILHDTLEDTRATESEISDAFGEEVLNLILGASEPDREGTWKDRKDHTIHFLKTAKRDIQLIALCDKFSNLSDMEKDFEAHGGAFWERFNAGVEDQRWYYESLVDSLSALSDLTQYKEFARLVKRVFSNHT